MTRLFIPPPCPGLPLALWFTPVPGNMTYKTGLPDNFFEREVTRVSDARDAAAIVLPNNFHRALVPAEVAYLKRAADLGERFGKPVCVFALTDTSDRIVFDPRVHALRFSLYRHTKQRNDISIPNQIEDLGAGGITLRTKSSRPTVSFCGLATPPAGMGRVKYYIKNAWFEFRALAAPALRARKAGVYWRRAALGACAASPCISTNFIVRKSFSGNLKTIELDPEAARRAFIESIEETDFVLAPKGDGNFSNRFLEALSLGRIPVLIDTDVILPLEEEIDYAKIVVRVPMNEVAKTPLYIRTFYDALSELEWQERQQLARDTFTTYLRQDAFLRHFFAKSLGRA